MPRFNGKQLQQQLWAFLVFIQLHIMMYLLFLHRPQQPSPAPPPAARQRPRVRHNIFKFLPEVCRAIQDEFTREYLRCSTAPDKWKELEREFRIRWNVPNALGAIDGKHVALKKPKNTRALYHNYSGFFFIVMLALMDGQYKFRWVDVFTAGSCSYI